MTRVDPTLERQIAAKLGIPLKATVPKYRNRRVQVDGVWYDSEKEAAYASILQARRLAREIAGYQYHKVFELHDRKDVYATSYEADFVVYYFDRPPEIHEVKGYINDKDPVTRLWRLKVQLCEAEYGLTAIII